MLAGIPTRAIDFPAVRLIDLSLWKAAAAWSQPMGDRITFPTDDFYVRTGGEDFHC